MQSLKIIFVFLVLSLIFVACSDEKVKSIDLGTGEASWYGPGFHGNKTANGEKYNMHSYTAAHKWLQFGSIVKVTNLDNNSWVKVRINDRGPYYKNRVIDLSKSAAGQIGLLKSGIANVRIELIGYHPNNFKALYLHYWNLVNIRKKIKK
jgi:rare lipoprotein A